MYLLISVFNTNIKKQSEAQPVASKYFSQIDNKRNYKKHCIK
jgi:hypothetical protein